MNLEICSKCNRLVEKGSHEGLHVAGYKPQALREYETTNIVYDRKENREEAKNDKS